MNTSNSSHVTSTQWAWLSTPPLISLVLDADVSGSVEPRFAILVWWFLFSLCIIINYLSFLDESDQLSTFYHNQSLFPFSFFKNAHLPGFFFQKDAARIVELRCPRCPFWIPMSGPMRCPHDVDVPRQYPRQNPRINSGWWFGTMEFLWFFHILIILGIVTPTDFHIF